MIYPETATRGALYQNVLVKISQIFFLPTTLLATSRPDSSETDLFSKNRNKKNTYFTIFPISQIFQLFWLPYCFTDYSNLLIADSSNSSWKTLPDLQFQGNLTSKNAEPPDHRTSPNQQFIAIMPTT